MRTLYTVPLLHSPNEILFEARDEFANLPEEQTRPYLRFVDSYWDTIEKRIQGYEVQRVYMDGYTGGSWDVVAQHANRGSRVAKTVVDLISKGATLETTDEIGLIAKTHEAYAKLRSMQNLTVKDIDREYISTVISRDLFMSRNVRATLRENERGMLFHGVFHSPLNFKDVQLVGIYSRKKLRKKLLRIGIQGEIIANTMDVYQKILEHAEKSGFLQQLEDIVDNPKKYGYNYSV